ncbi:MAG: phospholipase D-like domain-containing protein [Candidatus Saccharimonadales bacterium]
MYNLVKSTTAHPTLSSVSSQLYDEKTFYGAFLRDARKARTTIIIESPFITLRRFDVLYPAIELAIRRGVRIVINTRPPESHESPMSEQAFNSINAMQELGVEVIYTVNLHRKIAIIDDSILWEGSLNILSQSNSCEMMRRTQSADTVQQMIRFTKLSRWYNGGSL